MLPAGLHSAPERHPQRRKAYSQQVGAGRAAADRPRRRPIPGPPIGSGTHSGKGDATMMKHFTPPIVIPIAVLLLIAIATLVRLRMGW
jgi:hypothetical protein